ncbi:GMC family oxidoreductase [Palleronia caenipelagi]|uniref:FAD-dependent oxidoreductase n=1 Tax=Palleronia caenipelagi TaxID=2489174 RepID=A0A547PMI6_9RHOB|nr:GMC family oxidoreductase N-terminal domain-containing protein [Palleronia caenipelagi]TRD15351.1 FAD-dependent oxidoreductase [Palleronia caenipelagi]
MDGFDYIIVGSGTAGATLASRLTEDPACSVLVLEAGGPDRGLWLKLPVGYYKSIYNSRVSHLYRSEPDDGIDGRQMDCPRGRVLGGSSSINGLIYIRGQAEDFDDWEALGAEGWGYRDVLPHFRSLETYSGPPSQYRGAHGPLQVSDLRMTNPACEDWLNAAREWGLPDNYDLNGESSYGVGRYQLTLRGRFRDSAATAFLKPAMARPNLTVQLRARVTRLVFEGNRVTGVEYAQGGQIITVHADREVILSAGAVQTPQILQLAGIGPADHLRAMGIVPRHDAPEVGENLQDHLQMRSIVELTDTHDSLNDHVRDPIRLARMGLDWLIGSKGPLTVGAGQYGGGACTSHAKGRRPDIQLFVMPLSVDKPGKPLHRYSGFTTSVWQCHPESRGSIRIASTDPAADPQIRPNYLSTQKDRDVLVEGIKIVREIFAQPAFRNRWSREVVPGGGVQTDDEILTAIRKGATTVYHLVGTCRMGTDDSAVVDPTLRVNGVSGLRVVDASVMPKITSANTNAATFMIAEKAAQLLKQTS